MRLLIFLVMLVFALGLAWRVWGWLKVPAPLSIPLYPFPSSAAAGAGRMLAGWLFWPGLLKRDPWAWLGAAVFHLSLLVVLLGHLRLVLLPVPDWVIWLRGPAVPAAWIMSGSLMFLLLRRLTSPRLQAISRPGDYLLLLLLMSAAGSGLVLSYLNQADLAAIKPMLLSLLGRGQAAPGPQSAAFYLHLILAAALAVLAPFSKLIHPLALALTPLINRRRKRFAQGSGNPWDHEYTGDAPSQEALHDDEPRLYTLPGYRNYLKRHWSSAGVRRVLGAGEREGSS